LIRFHLTGKTLPGGQLECARRTAHYSLEQEKLPPDVLDEAGDGLAASEPRALP
jgi:hypothetical protein